MEMPIITNIMSNRSLLAKKINIKNFYNSFFIPLFTFFLIGFSMISCNKNNDESRVMTPLEAFGEFQNGFAIILDIRDISIVNQTGLAAPAQHIPYADILNNSPVWQDFLARFDKDKNLAIYCNRGVKAEVIKNLLRKQGIKAFNIGGFKDWQEAKLPITATTSGK